jgi:hypothetical protein
MQQGKIICGTRVIKVSWPAWVAVLFVVVIY